MGLLAAALLLVLAFVLTGLEAAWQGLDRVRLRHRAEKGDSRARRMMACEGSRPQTELALAWSSHACAAASLVIAAQEAAVWSANLWWVAPAAFVPLYAFGVQVVARQIFRRLPFLVLSRMWWLVGLAGWACAPLARPVAALLRRVNADPLPRRPAGEDLLEAAGQAEGISPLEQTMLRGVLGFRSLTAGELAVPVTAMPGIGADETLADVLADRSLAGARFVLVLGADDTPLGAMACSAAALSGAAGARAQSFARPLLSLTAEMSAWKALAQLRRARTPVAQVMDAASGSVVGVLSEDIAVARLLGRKVWGVQ